MIILERLRSNVVYESGAVYVLLRETVHDF